MPYRCDERSREILMGLRRAYGSAVRMAHKLAACPSADGKDFVFVDEKDVRDAVKRRFGHSTDIDAWLVHCATRDGIALRKRVPDGSTVFGGRKNLIRRHRGLITKDEWRALRLRPLASLGDKSFKGNRHFRLSEDARTCTVRVYGTAVTLELPELNGKWGELLPDVAKLAALGEMNVTFRLGKTLDATFDPMDLRKLPKGQTLQQAKDIGRGEKKSRGRPRGVNYAPPEDNWETETRPVHPEWRSPVPQMAGRWLGIDNNPNWFGLTVVESDGTLTGTKVLDWRLVTPDLPKDASNETVREALAAVVTQAMSLARAWNVSGVAVENGLGKLRSGGPNRNNNRLINYWARNALLSILERRCALAGLAVTKVWCAWSTVIGNTAFEIPDACAAGAEIARRGLCTRRGEVSLPAYEPELARRRWKDDARVEAEIRVATDWQGYQRGVNAARDRSKDRSIGIRRPHPALAGIRPRPGQETITVDGLAVTRLGMRRRPGLVARIPSHAQAGRVNGTVSVGTCRSTLKSE